MLGLFKTIALTLGVALSLTMTPAVPANAATMGLPPRGVATGQWLRAYCQESGNYYDLHGLYRAGVRYVNSAKAKYYQRVKLTVRYTENGTDWHTVDSKTRDSGTFRSRNLPTYTTPGIKTSAGLNYVSSKTFRVRAIVKLKRVLPGRIPDVTSWSYATYSGTFICPITSIGIP